MKKLNIVILALCCLLLCPLIASADTDIYHEPAEDQLRKLCSVDGLLVNPEKVGCMVGTMLGVFASGNGTDSDNEAVFDWFDCGEI